MTFTFKCHSPNSKAYGETAERKGTEKDNQSMPLPEEKSECKSVGVALWPRGSE